jgi:hypothetical protein
MDTPENQSNTTDKWHRSLIVSASITDPGFIALLDNGSTEEIAWTEIERIVTYKVDNYVYDTIWLAFVKGGVLLQISEEEMGFVDLMAAMNRAFPTIDQEWYMNVMLPTFEEKMTVLFER